MGFGVGGEAPRRSARRRRIWWLGSRVDGPAQKSGDRTRISLGLTDTKQWLCATAAALALLCGPACSRAERQAQEPSGSHGRGSEIQGLFEHNPDIAALTLPRGRGAAKVCATPDVLMALYPGRGVYAVTRDNPFARMRDPSDVCSVRITWQPSNGRDIFAAPTCRIRIGASGVVEIVVPEGLHVSELNVSQFEGSDEEFLASECFYRLALVLEGYTGGLTTNAFGPHPNSAYFVGRREHIGPVVAPLIQEITYRCPDVLGHYYRPSLESVVIGDCLARIRGVHHGR